MNKRIIACFCLSMGLAANAQTVNVRGKVTDAAGNPLAKAVVAIVGQGLADTTGSDGAFSITKNLTAVKGSTLPSAGPITLNQSVLNLFVANPASIQVEVFDVKGHLLAKAANANASAGVYQLNIAEMVPAENLVLVHAAIGGHTENFRYFGMRNDNPAAKPALVNISRRSAGLAKVAAVIDTLQASAAGFATKSIPLSSYDTTLTVSLDSAGGEILTSAGCGKTRTLQNGTLTLQFNGATRNYILAAPSKYTNSHPYRLVIAYSWSSGSASDVANSNYFTFATMDPTNTIFVAPNASDGAGTWSNTDVAFTDSILAQVEGNLCIDKTRVFASGFSFGGGMAMAIACTRASEFRAVAFFSGADLTNSCPTTLTTPIAYYASQASQDRGSLPANSPIAGETIQANFAAINGCTPEPNSTNYPASGQPHTCTIYPGCSAGHPTEYCVFNGPHGWQPVDPGQSTSWDPPEAWKFITQF